LQVFDLVRARAGAASAQHEPGLSIGEFGHKFYRDSSERA
jgi:hypothetical protein